MNKIVFHQGASEPSHGLDHRISAVAHPSEIIDHPGLSLAEKRAILAGWASDARALEGAPALRQLDSGAIVPIDAILDALRALDGSARSDGARRPGAQAPFERRRGRLAARLRSKVFRLGRRDDDDDPPPCPAAMAWPARPSWVTACGAH